MSKCNEYVNKITGTSRVEKSLKLTYQCLDKLHELMITGDVYKIKYCFSQ